MGLRIPLLLLSVSSSDLPLRLDSRHILLLSLLTFYFCDSPACGLHVFDGASKWHTPYPSASHKFELSSHNFVVVPNLNSEAVYSVCARLLECHQTEIAAKTKIP